MLLKYNNIRTVFIKNMFSKHRTVSFYHIVGMCFFWKIIMSIIKSNSNYSVKYYDAYVMRWQVVSCNSGMSQPVLSHRFKSCFDRG